MITELVQARAILHGDLEVSIQRQRSACWLTRAAFERVVRDLLTARDLDVGKATMRTALCCLEIAYRDSHPQLGRRAEYAWAGLSRAAHHHAYELSPTTSEVEELIDIVAELAAMSDADASVAAPSSRC